MSYYYFSIIIPTFNREQALRKVLLAVLKQTYVSFEVIIMDDGGSDDTETMVASFKDPRVKYFRQVNSGPLIARYNAAIKATGKWLAFCDSDDIWDANYLEVNYQAINKFLAKVCFTDYQVEGEQESRLKPLVANSFFESSLVSKYNECWELDARLFYKSLMYKQPLMISAFMIEKNTMMILVV